MDEKGGKQKDALSGIARVGLALLFPPAPVVAVSPFAIVALLIWGFYLGNEGTPGAYAAYVVMAYALTVIVAAIVKAATNAPTIDETLDEVRKVHPLVARLIDDALFRSVSIARLGLVIDVLWAAASFFWAWWEESLWTFTLAVYYTCLAVMRAFLSRHERTPHADPAAADRRICLSCGVTIMLLALPTSGIVLLNLTDFGTFSHHMYITIGIAAYAFMKLGAGIRNFVRYRDGSVPVRLALSSVSFSGALATMLTMSILMVHDFGSTPETTGEFKFVMTSWMGLAVSLGIFAVGLALVLRSRKIGREV